MQMKSVRRLCAAMLTFAVAVRLVTAAENAYYAGALPFGQAQQPDAVYAVHILLIDRVSPHVDGIKLSCLQFFVSGVFSGIGMLLFEEVKPELLWSAAGSIAYSGIMSSGVAFTLQILGQQRTEPTLASMLMSLESVFAMLTGMLVLHEIPTLREALGCVLMFAAILAAQLPENKKTPPAQAPAPAADAASDR